MKLDEVLAAGGPWYGLPKDVEVRRLVRGHGGGSQGFHLTLGHDWGNHERVLDVNTNTERRAPEVSLDVLSANQYLARVTTLRGATPESFPIRLEIDRDEIEVAVDGSPTRFVRIGDAVDWVAYAHVDDRLVELFAHDLPGPPWALEAVDPREYWSPPDW
jgi:hypothetical protein